MTDTNLADLFNLNNKVAVVTGGAGIIGSRVCHGLATFGAKVVIAELNMEAANELAEEIMREHDAEVFAVHCDISSPESLSEMVSKVAEKFGGIHVLLNNAQTKTDDLESFFAPFEEYPLSMWREIMEVNLDGMFLTAQAVGKYMVEQNQGGSIIQTASTYGIVGPDHRIYEGSEYMGVEINTPPVYAASKAAVVGLTKYLATYWADKNIRVNTLVPGGVESGQNAQFLKNYSFRTPLGRMAQRDEMVGAVIFMSSNASSYMTGQMVVVDGGWTSW
jgi:NAD(P)-dependent dehydrogenase (short-subunit alcohol dehydrogenase family)